MSRRTFAIGAALIWASAAWLLFTNLTLAQIERGPAPTRTPDRGPSPTPIPGATPTIDRLAPPPTAAVPNQADEGAQLFWLHCQPCHGDQGQGLTDDWRAQYPPEDQNCWESGCHGKQPYGQGFTLPTIVPAVIGDNVLQKFETMDAVYRYTSVAMPYFFPGDLAQEEYLAILAHIARENGLWDGTPLTVDNLGNYRIHAGLVTANATPAPVPVETAVPATAAQTGSVDWTVIGLLTFIALLISGGFILWRNRAS